MDTTDTATPCDPRSRVFLVLCDFIPGQRLRIHHQSRHDNSITPTTNLFSSSVILCWENRTVYNLSGLAFLIQSSQRAGLSGTLGCAACTQSAELRAHGPVNSLTVQKTPSRKKNLCLSEQLSSNANLTDMNFIPFSQSKLQFSPK